MANKVNTYLMMSPFKKLFSIVLLGALLSACNQDQSTNPTRGLDSTSPLENDPTSTALEQDARNRADANADENRASADANAEADRELQLKLAELDAATATEQANLQNQRDGADRAANENIARIEAEADKQKSADTLTGDMLSSAADFGGGLMDGIFGLMGDSKYAEAEKAQAGALQTNADANMLRASNDTIRAQAEADRIEREENSVANQRAFSANTGVSADVREFRSDIAEGYSNYAATQQAEAAKKNTEAQVLRYIHDNYDAFEGQISEAHINDIAAALGGVQTYQVRNALNAAERDGILGRTEAAEGRAATYVFSAPTEQGSPGAQERLNLRASDVAGEAARLKNEVRALKAEAELLANLNPHTGGVINGTYYSGPEAARMLEAARQRLQVLTNGEFVLENVPNQIRAAVDSRGTETEPTTPTNPDETPAGQPADQRDAASRVIRAEAMNGVPDSLSLLTTPDGSLSSHRLDDSSPVALIGRTSGDSGVLIGAVESPMTTGKYLLVAGLDAEGNPVTGNGEVAQWVYLEGEAGQPLTSTLNAEQFAQIPSYERAAPAGAVQAPPVVLTMGGDGNIETSTEANIPEGATRIDLDAVPESLRAQLAPEGEVYAYVNSNNEEVRLRKNSNGEYTDFDGNVVVPPENASVQLASNYEHEVYLDQATGKYHVKTYEIANGGGDLLVDSFELDASDSAATRTTDRQASPETDAEAVTELTSEQAKIAAGDADAADGEYFVEDGKLFKRDLDDPNAEPAEVASKVDADSLSALTTSLTVPETPAESPTEVKPAEEAPVAEAYGPPAPTAEEIAAAQEIANADEAPSGEEGPQQEPGVQNSTAIAQAFDSSLTTVNDNDTTINNFSSPAVHGPSQPGRNIDGSISKSAYSQPATSADLADFNEETKQTFNTLFDADEDGEISDSELSGLSYGDLLALEDVQGLSNGQFEQYLCQAGTEGCSVENIDALDAEVASAIEQMNALSEAKQALEGVNQELASLQSDLNSAEQNLINLRDSGASGGAIQNASRRLSELRAQVSQKTNERNNLNQQVQNSSSAANTHIDNIEKYKKAFDTVASTSSVVRVQEKATASSQRVNDVWNRLAHGMFEVESGGTSDFSDIQGWTFSSAETLTQAMIDDTGRLILGDSDALAMGGSDLNSPNTQGSGGSSDCPVNQRNNDGTCA